MFKRLLVALLLLMPAFHAKAGTYTDVYYDHTSDAVNEDGWGVFVVQNDTTQFLAFFIYGPDGKPTWYTAQLADDGTGKYTGTLYAITGTYFANPWQGYNINPAGTATFAPTDAYHATLTYTVNGVGTISKPLRRQTLAVEKMSGTYSGSMAGNISGCQDPATNDPALRARYVLVVTQLADASATLVFTFTDPNHTGLVCTTTGPLTHFGLLYQMAGATTLACTGLGTDGNARPATIDRLHPTGQGIEGKLTGNFGGGCMGTLHFAAVFNRND